jgi:hypothetical protein
MAARFRVIRRLASNQIVFLCDRLTDRSHLVFSLIHAKFMLNWAFLYSYTLNEPRVGDEAYFNESYIYNFDGT